eukprot:Blabericola_migrator_1__5@NODE_1001_length_5735_cov_490_698659_g689_i0_p3_GENE_NODE_1001_length_5735_cov_490_698659_g689_i0NODE_1001_length_5735_cov_490_698659_g689_i0_p3_ORF_typecomplete_len381_score51_78Galactosyl_T/PF01762_21/6_6e23Fringe/PF02434_16/0_12_NODE_1001_length_5735_cov_490_698659_g689_i013612503
MPCNTGFKLMRTFQIFTLFALVPASALRDCDKRRIRWALQRAPDEVWDHLRPDLRTLPLDDVQPPDIEALEPDYVESFLSSLGKKGIESAAINITELVHMKPFASFIQEPQNVPIADLDATALILTIPKDAKKRRQMRALHTKYYAPLSNVFKIGMFFPVGAFTTKGEDLTEELLQEAEEYGDLLILNFTESWTTLSTKVMSAFFYFKSQASRPEQVLIKLDDDVVVNWPAMQMDLAQRGPHDGRNLVPALSSTPIWIGQFMHDSKRLKTWRSKYLEIFHGEGLFPSYTNGPLFLMNKPTVDILVERRLREFPIPMRNDDAMLGDLAFQTPITRLENDYLVRSDIEENTCDWWWQARRFRLLKTVDFCLQRFVEMAKLDE